MKLRNKKTGEIKDIEFNSLVSGNGDCCALAKGEPEIYVYNSLAELNEEWEDYKDDCYGITHFGQVRKIDKESDTIESMKEIGNYFETEEEAEKAVETLKAWKRLKDKGIKIVGWDYSDNVDLNGCKFIDDDFIVGLSDGDIDEEDLDLLFGGEE